MAMNEKRIARTVEGIVDNVEWENGDLNPFNPGSPQLLVTLRVTEANYGDIDWAEFARDKQIKYKITLEELGEPRF